MTKEQLKEKIREKNKLYIDPKLINISILTGMTSCARDRIRELVRIRDKHTCQICGKKWNPELRKLDVHHIDCKKEKTRQCDDWETEKQNMITLCHKCHLNLPEHKKAIQDGLINSKKTKIKKNK